MQLNEEKMPAATYRLVVISPAMNAMPVVTRVSAATRQRLSSAMMASRMALEI